MNKPKDSFLTTLSNGYRFAALILLNTLIGLFILNGVLSVVFKIKDTLIPNPVSRKYGHSIISSIYQNISPRELHDLLEETWSRPYIYEPFTQFKERPYKGSYVNVDTNGFRYTKNQGTWPPQSKSLNIFLFGGSTTFGYGVQDDQTIASHLQEYLTKKIGADIRVYNFGRGHYYLTQERILYEELLTSGFIPDLVIFIDGLNEFYFIENEPFYTERLRKFFATGIEVPTKKALEALVSKTSLHRAAVIVQKRVDSLLMKEEPNNQLMGPIKRNIKDIEYNNPVLIDQVIERYLTNKKLIEAISNNFGVKPIFVWQPIPTYNYDEYYHPFAEGGYSKHSYSKYGYIRMANLTSEKPIGSNFFWCADIQRDLKEPLYVDKVHYSASFSKLFAEAIANLLMQRTDLKKQPDHITTDRN